MHMDTQSQQEGAFWQVKQHRAVLLEVMLDYGTADERVFLCGASSKDAGARITSIVEDYGTAKYNSVIAGLLKNSPLVLPK